MARDHEEPDSLGNDVRMSGDEGQFSEIEVFLAQTWQSSATDRIDLNTISRIWAFDLGWFNMETANRVRDNLIEAGWLDASSEGVKPNIMIENVDVPFGWLPTMRILESPPQAPRQTLMPPTEVAVDVTIEEEEIEVAPTDPAAAHITKLLEQITDASGLERKEVMRRAQRKRRALGPVTLWMALLLVAREQNLMMPTFLRTIAN
ncbi:MAG TPA: DUF2240 family protein [Candidatus Poseidoniales archaeon]|nr:MAG TPA: DUF2240 family protein [Candidatus Poseidoniales archaeon]